MSPYLPPRPCRSKRNLPTSTFAAPPPSVHWLYTDARTSTTSLCAIASSLPSGTNPSWTSSLGKLSYSRETRFATCSIIVTCVSFSSLETRPQSRMHSLPSVVLSKFPGCGSAWTTPISRSIVKYVFIATEQSEVMSPVELSSNRLPRTHSVVSTFLVVSSFTTGGAHTAPASGVPSMNCVKRSALAASSK